MIGIDLFAGAGGLSLGPNMMSRETNLLQIHQLVDDNKILPISKDTENHVLNSRIDHYRS